MACRLVGAKPLSKPMMGYCQFDPPGTNSSGILHRNWNIFIQENTFENVVSKIATISSQSQCVKLLLRLMQLQQISRYITTCLRHVLPVLKSFGFDVIILSHQFCFWNETSLITSRNHYSFRTPISYMIDWNHAAFQAALLWLILNLWRYAAT